MKRSQPATTSPCSSPSSPIFQSEKKRGNKHPKRNNHKSQNYTQDNKETTIAGKRTSIYKGVTRHRCTGRFEAHLWDKCSWNKTQNKKGRQVYLGAYDSEEAAARTYDLAALKYWGKDASLNFPVERYEKEVEEMAKASKEEYLGSLRRQSSGFSRGISKYRGVARHHHNGRWEARIGRVHGNKYLYLGTFKTEEEAAVAYDKAAIEHRGINAVTNFDISNYSDKLKTKNDQIEATTIFSDLEDVEEEQQQTTTPQHENHQMQPQQHQVQQTEGSSLVNVMDFALEKDLPWSFMYTELSQFQNTDLALTTAEEDLMRMFDGSGFEEDIDVLFNTEPGGGENGYITSVLDSIDIDFGERKGGAESIVEGKEQRQRLSLDSSSSSPSSTTTVCCNYSL